MQARWRKKAEIEQEQKDISDSAMVASQTTPNNTDIINLNWKDDDNYQRQRKISHTEKLYKGIEKGAILFTKLKLKFTKTPKTEEIQKLKVPDIGAKKKSEEERETFRNLISFVFSDQYLDEFLSVCQALGFKELGGFDYLGRRDADYSIGKDVEQNSRLHFRAYKIKGNMFVLTHHEPRATEDISLHVKGFFDRILSSIIRQKNDPTVKIGEEAGSPIDGHKIELSNYELGTDLFLKMLKEQVPNFYRKINSKITDADLDLWKEHMGIIDHKPAEDLIIENLIESSRLIPPFSQIRDTVKKIFESLNFTILPAWDLKVTASDKFFIAKTTYAKREFEILVITEDAINELMRPIGLLRAKYHPKFTILISPDISIFGPEPDDIPPTDIEIPKYEPAQVKDLLNFLADSGVSVMPVSLCIDLFRLHKKTPIRHSHLSILLNNKGLLKPEMIQEILQEHDTYQKYIQDILNVFDVFKRAPKGEWISVKHLQKMVKTNEIELNTTELNNAIVFMENPLLNILESKNNKREDYRIQSTLTEEDLEFRTKKMKYMLEEYLIEQESTSSYL